jgi:hypothetical protein
MMAADGPWQLLWDIFIHCIAILFYSKSITSTSVNLAQERDDLLLTQLVVLVVVGVQTPFQFPSLDEDEVTQEQLW